MSTRTWRALQATGLALFAIWTTHAVGTAAEPSASDSRAVARVFGRTITLDDLTPPAATQSIVKERESETDYGEWLRDVRVLTLRKLIWEEVTQHHLEGFELEPTQAEVDSLGLVLISEQDHWLNQLKAERAEVTGMLARDDLPADRRTRLEERLVNLEEQISSEQADRERSAAVPGHEEAQRQAVDSVARITVRNWKENKALYEKYGGRVIYQQAGNEPIDAYRALIEELDEDRAVEILDPCFPDPFVRLRAYFELRHSYMSKEDADQYFDQPWWLARP